MRSTLLCSSLFVLLTLPCAAADDFPTPNTEKATTAPMPPEEVCQTAKLPPGFELGVFAAEPDVQNPIAMTFDERGRLWVAENYTYAGAQSGWFDTSLRDRVIILEDADGDGRHDRRTVFWDQGRKLTSVEVGFGGVWVLCAPQLLFIPDTNRDDVPDGPPVVVLDGFGEGPVGHNIVNGLKWGPDGWLYGRHGIQETSQIGKPGAGESQRVKINTGIWRYHPTRGLVEAVMHGMTNAWGFDFDEHGEMFCSNTVIGHLWHIVPGAHVRRMYGVDINPHAYQLIEQTADHVHWDAGEQWNNVQAGVTDKTSAAGGGHAHCGLLIYQGDNWPEEYRGRAYMLNMHGRRINCDILVRQGAGYTAEHGPDMCFIADEWYRGMDLITGPDGGVFIADWSDTGECHDHDGVHRTSGRIYKLTYRKADRIEPFDLTEQSDEQLVELQTHENEWWTRQARRILQERASRGELAATTPQLLTSKIIRPGALRRDALRWLWVLHAVDMARDDFLIHNLAEGSKRARPEVLRLLADQLRATDEPPTAVTDALNAAANIETEGLACLWLAASLQRLPMDKRWTIAESLVAKKEFAYDRMFPLMLWYGIESTVPRDPARAIALAKSSQIPLVRQNISRRLTLEIERDPATVEKLLDLAIQGNAAHSEEIIAGMALALNGWRKAPPPANWPQAAEKFANSDSADVRRHVQALRIVFGDGVALDELRKIATNGQAEPEARRQALRALLAGKPAELAPVLQNLLGDRAVLTDALRGLALYDHPDTPKRILNGMGIYSPEARAEMINTLASRPIYAKVLLQAVREKKIAASEISAFHARQIRAFEDADLTAQLAELWGEVRPSAADKRSLIDRYKSELTPEAFASADLSAGRLVFQKTCANCHVLYGVGRQVGPDLTGSNRKNLDYLLENLADPSASVATDFRVLVVTLDDGRVLNGVVSQQNERTLTLLTQQESITIDRREIEESEQTANSPMPDGQLQNFTADQVRDLVAYLMSTDQVPLPAGQ